MTDFSRTYDFTSKDALPTGNPSKLIKGSEVDEEFDNVVTAVASKYDSVDLASQAQAEAGTSNLVLMTPLRTEQWKTNWITESVTFSGAFLGVSNSTATLRLTESDATADEGVWQWQANGDTLLLATVDDALSATVNAVRVLRTGTTVDEIELNATTLDVNAAVDFSGDLTITNATSANIYWVDSGAAADEKRWRMWQDGGALAIATRTDANGIGNTAMVFVRTGTNIDEVQIDADLVDINATGASGLRVSGATYLGDANATANPLRLVASDSIGDVWMSFLENDATTRKGLIGYQGTSDNNLVIENEESATLELWTNAGSLIFSGNSGTTHHLEIASDGGVTTQNTDADEVGYKGTPQTTHSAASSYPIVLTDAGKQIYLTGSATGATIPANASVAFPVGTGILIINDTGGSVSISITTDTLEWALGGGTGTRTLADNGMAFVSKITSTVWKISGAGLS